MPHVLLSGRPACLCACGGTIVAMTGPLLKAISYAVEAHNRTERHQSWRVDTRWRLDDSFEVRVASPSPAGPAR